MIQTSRRNLLVGAAAIALAAATPALAQETKVDLSDLLTPPKEGDMVEGVDTAVQDEYWYAIVRACADFIPYS